AASACLGAVVAYGASRVGGGETGLRGQVAVDTPKAGSEGQQGKVPPRPSFIEKPESTSLSSVTQFRFHVAPRSHRLQPGLPASAPAGGTQRSRRHFQCRYDGSAWQACSSPHRLGAVQPGPHSFAVRILARAGRVGPAAAHSWTQAEPKPIAIEAAGPAEDLHPGFPAQALPVRISNPNGVPVEVTSLTVELPFDPPSCPSNSFELTPSSASAASPLAIPAGGSVSLPSDEVSAPAIAMLNLPVNQDACQGARLQLLFSGEAHG
ncbi:MAG TPA: hypothetical protein VF259_03150, partial [Solirubrobacterales bacterium]